MLISWKRILRKKVCWWCVDQQATLHKELAISNIELLDSEHYLCAHNHYSITTQRNRLALHAAFHSTNNNFTIEMHT